MRSASRGDDTGATLRIVCLEGVAETGRDEFKQCEGWHPPRRSEKRSPRRRRCYTIAC